MQLTTRNLMALRESGIDFAREKEDGELEMDTEMDCESPTASESSEHRRASNLSRNNGSSWNALSLYGAPKKPDEPRRTAGGKTITSLVLARDGCPSTATDEEDATEQETQDDDDDSSMLCTEGSNSDDDCDAASQSSAFGSTAHPALSLRASPKSRRPNSLRFSPTTGMGQPASTNDRHEGAGPLSALDAENHSAKSPPGEMARPDPLSFLENDSPPVTDKSILQAIAHASENWSPRSVSSFGSMDGSQQSAAGTAFTTPDHSVAGESPPSTALPGPSQLIGDRSSVTSGNSPKTKRPARARRPQLHPHLDSAQNRYGTPEMARGSAKHPHFRPDELQPRLVAPGQGYPKYLPRAEKLPLTGYELLAAKLSTSDPRPVRRGSNSSSQSDEGPAIKPIYRKFETLNHRLLLHLQDELTELEEQLHRLDTADTQTRRLQNCILPASRRAEAMAGGELQWRKTDTLGKIGFKLTQYSKCCNNPQICISVRGD